MEEIQVEEQKPEQYATEIDFEQCDAVEPTEDTSWICFIFKKTFFFESKSNRNQIETIAGWWLDAQLSHSFPT